MTQIIYTISDNKLAEYKLGFLANQPIPIDGDGNPTLSENDWIKEWGKQQFISAYLKGKVKLEREGIDISNLIT